MPNPQANQPIINAGDRSVFNFGNGNPTNLANDQARAEQVNSAGPVQQLEAAIDQLLALTADDKTAHRELRSAAREMQNDLESDGAVSGEKRSLFERAAAALPSTHKAVDTVAKIADLVCKAPGLGA